MDVLYTLINVILPLVAHWCPCVEAQNPGDIRLVGGGSANSGRVEVFLSSNQQWSTICDCSFGGAADVVCYQFNHTYSASSQRNSVKLMNKSLKKAGKPLIKNATSGTPISLTDVDCGSIYSRPLVTTHILQCDYKLVEEGSECTHDDDLAVVCDTEADRAYNSEVRLVGGGASSVGTLEIYLNKKWGNVCFRAQGFHQATADTVCRQMGYTHASEFKGTGNKTAEVVWLKDVACDSIHSCLNACFEKQEFNETTCPGGTYVAVQCSFVPARKIDVRGFFGNPVMCSLQRRYTKTPAYFVAILSVSSIFWIISSAAIIVLAVCFSSKKCPCYKLRRKRTTYTPIN